MLASPQPITLRQYTDANSRITALFNSMHEVINMLDHDHVKGKVLRNTRDLFPMADSFVRNVTDATYNIHEAYIDYIQNGNSSHRNVELIETEADRIFNEIRKVILQARKLDVHPVTEEFRYIKEPNFDDLNEKQFQDTKRRNGNNTFRSKQGPIQTALFEEARRLGPEYGAHFLMGVEDTFLSTLDMLHALKEAGLKLDENLLHNVEATPEMWGQSGARHKTKEVAQHITQMYGLIDEVGNSIQHQNPSTSEISNTFIKHIKKSTDNLSTLYNQIASEKEPLSVERRQELESAFREIFSTIKRLIDHIEERLIIDEGGILSQQQKHFFENLDNMTDAAKIFHNMPQKGLLSTRASYLAGVTNSASEKELLGALYHLVCHTAGTAMTVGNQGLVEYSKTVFPARITEIAIDQRMATGIQPPDENHLLKNEIVDKK